MDYPCGPGLGRLSITVSFYCPLSIFPKKEGAEKLTFLDILSTYCVLWALAVILFNLTITRMVGTIIFMFANEAAEAQSPYSKGWTATLTCTHLRLMPLTLTALTPPVLCLSSVPCLTRTVCF